MDEFLKIGASVSTPIGLMGLLGVIGLLVYLRNLRHRERVLDALPSEQRSRAIEDELTRLGIDGGNLTRDQKFQLIKEKLERSSRQTLVIIVIMAIVFTLCFGISAYAFLKHTAQPQPVGGGTQTNTGPTVAEELQLGVVDAGPDDVALPLTFEADVVLHNPGATTETLLSMFIALDTGEETGLTFNPKEEKGPFVLKAGDKNPVHLKLRVQKEDFENSAIWKGPELNREAIFSVSLRVIAVSPEGSQVKKRIKLGDLYYYDPTGPKQQIVFKPFESNMTGSLSLFK